MVVAALMMASCGAQSQARSTAEGVTADQLKADLNKPVSVPADAPVSSAAAGGTTPYNDALWAELNGELANMEPASTMAIRSRCFFTAVTDLLGVERIERERLDSDAISVLLEEPEFTRQAEAAAEQCISATPSEPGQPAGCQFSALGHQITDADKPVDVSTTFVLTPAGFDKAQYTFSLAGGTAVDLSAELTNELTEPAKLHISGTSPDVGLDMDLCEGVTVDVSLPEGRYTMSVKSKSVDVASTIVITK
jgi:hypothetical protein